MPHGPERLARLIEVDVETCPDDWRRATSRDLPALNVCRPDESGLDSALPGAIREALLAEEPCVALPVGRLSDPAGTWVAIPDALARAALAA